MSDWDFVQTMFYAVTKGSKEPSPFLHFSWDHTEARNWHMQGKTSRKENRSWMARVSVDSLRELAEKEKAKTASSQVRQCVVLGQIIDLSTTPAQQCARPFCP